jgi:hypothetical protein
MLTLTAVNVVAPSGTAVRVAFYTEANPAAGAQPATDHFIGYGMKVGNNWVIAVGTRGTPAGTYTVYAIATVYNLSSSPVTATVTIQSSPTQTLPTGAATASVAKPAALPASNLAPACTVAPSTVKAPTASAVAINTKASQLNAMLAVTAGTSLSNLNHVAANVDASWWDAVNAALSLQQLPRALNQK